MKTQVVGLTEEVVRMMRPVIEMEAHHIFAKSINAKLKALDDHHKKVREEIADDLVKAQNILYDRIVVEAVDKVDESAHIKVYLKGSNLGDN